MGRDLAVFDNLHDSTAFIDMSNCSCRLQGDNMVCYYGDNVVEFITDLLEFKKISRRTVTFIRAYEVNLI